MPRRSVLHVANALAELDAACIRLYLRPRRHRLIDPDGSRHDPRLLAGAVLFRPLSPFRDELPTRLLGTPVLTIDGDEDARRSPGDGARLAEGLTRAGATVTHRVLPVGHSITAMDREIAREWLATGV